MNKYKVCWMWGTMPTVPQYRHKDGGKSDLIIEAPSMKAAAKQLKEGEPLPDNAMCSGEPTTIIVNQTATNYCMVYRYSDLAPFNLFEALTTGEL